MTVYDMTMSSFLSPTAGEPTSSCNVLSSIQSDHRHVTPMPFGVLHPEPPSSLPSNSTDMKKSASNNTTIDTVDSTAFTHKDNTAKINTTTSVSSGKSISHILTLSRDLFYNESTIFPVIVHRMITETSEEHGRSLMHWSDCGKFFWIKEKHTMLSNVLAQYFKRTFFFCLKYLLMLKSPHLFPLST